MVGVDWSNRSHVGKTTSPFQLLVQLSLPVMGLSLGECVFWTIYRLMVSGQVWSGYFFYYGLPVVLVFTLGASYFLLVSQKVPYQSLLLVVATLLMIFVVAYSPSSIRWPGTYLVPYAPISRTIYWIAPACLLGVVSGLFRRGRIEIKESYLLYAFVLTAILALWNGLGMYAGQQYNRHYLVLIIAVSAVVAYKWWRDPVIE